MGEKDCFIFEPLLCVQPFRQTDSATREATADFGFSLQKGAGRGFPGRDDHENRNFVDNFLRPDK